MIASKNIFTVVLWSFKTTRLSLLDIERKESVSGLSARRHIVLAEWEVFTILWMMNQWLVQTIIMDDGDWITARKHLNIVFFIILRPWLSDFSYCITQQGARQTDGGGETGGGGGCKTAVWWRLRLGPLITWCEPFQWVDNWCVKTELKHWVPPPPGRLQTGLQLNKSSIVPSINIVNNILVETVVWRADQERYLHINFLTDCWLYPNTETPSDRPTPSPDLWLRHQPWPAGSGHSRLEGLWVSSVMRIAMWYTR